MTPDPIRAARRAAALAKVKRLHAQKATVAQRLTQLERQLRDAERAACDELGYGVCIRGPQLLSAIERVEHA